MNVVGKVGSLLSQGVYSVATPFHPFGGAVDIIVVEQKDSTYRSTPWYVRFGKFQGVLKGAEKIVHVSVNDVEANFHMLLDNSGEAYFLREVVPGSEDMESHDQVANDFGSFKSIQDDDLENIDDDDDNEEVDDSMNLVKSSEESNSEVVLMSVDGHVITAPFSKEEESAENVQLSIPQFHLGPSKGSGEEFDTNIDVWNEDARRDLFHESEANNIEHIDVDSRVEETGKGMSTDLTVVKLGEKEESRCSEDESFSHEIILEEMAANLDHKLKLSASMPLPNSDLPLSADVRAVDIEIKHLGNNVSDNTTQEALRSENPIHDGSEFISAHPLSNDTHVGSSPEPERSDIEVECIKPDIVSMQRIPGFGFEISLCGHLLSPGMGRTAAKEAFEAHQISEDEFKTSGPDIIKNGNLVARYKEEYFSWDKIAHIIVGMVLFGLNFFVEPTDSIPVETRGISPSTYSSRWRLWPIPFRRVKSLQHSNSNCSSDDLFFDSVSCLESTCEEQTKSSSNDLSPQKNLIRTNMPTSDQVASLNLKDGQNTITFHFTTRVLGKQQVDAHIYLWKWNARIVISDVDGTITRSDVLGQVMPLVGRDWTQSGVARLFSAIKENGYQLLFLSARAIVQAYLTKSFLFNLKQDGKALPDGPVVISPDGLLPSLYREVIRRAPHEFKIACLQDIRALFPSDYNPFYAGFGNRDTDEITYQKIGIPKGKIFIINPKGEVVVNSCSNVKSYTSLHSLVDDMFPPTSLAEQEDYNSWNYWKISPQIIDQQPS